jgi:hypothetical protein
MGTEANNNMDRTNVHITLTYSTLHGHRSQQQHGQNKCSHNINLLNIAWTQKPEIKDRTNVHTRMTYSTLPALQGWTHKIES